MTSSALAGMNTESMAQMPRGGVRTELIYDSPLAFFLLSSAILHKQKVSGFPFLNVGHC